MMHHLEAAYGQLMFFQSGGCCDGTSPICLKDGDMPAGPHDVRLGRIGGAPFYIDSEQYERWGRPRFRDRRLAGRSGGILARGARRSSLRIANRPALGVIVMQRAASESSGLDRCGWDGRG